MERLATSTTTAPERHLAVVEGGRVLRNPAVWAAVALMGLWARSAWRTEDGEDHYNLLVGYGFVVPGFVIVMAVVLGVLRPRHAGTEELLSTLPVGPDRRSLGHGWSSVAGGAICLAWTVGLVVLLRPARTLGHTSDTQPVFQAIPRPNLAQLLQGPAAVVAVTTFAVALVRWIPTWLVALPLAFGAVSQLTLAGLWSGATVSLVTWLNPLARGWVNGPWLGGCGEGQRCELALSGFDRVTPWWHLAYLAALSVLFVVISVLRHRRDRVAWTALAIALASVVALAVAQFAVYERYTSSSGAVLSGAALLGAG